MSWGCPRQLHHRSCHRPSATCPARATQIRHVSHALSTIAVVRSCPLGVSEHSFVHHTAEHPPSRPLSLSLSLAIGTPPSCRRLVGLTRSQWNDPRGQRALLVDLLAWLRGPAARLTRGTPLGLGHGEQEILFNPGWESNFWSPG